MHEKTILVVEDNAVNRKLILTVLKPHGYRLLIAHDGEEAVQTAKQERPDLILMDLQLPKVNGFVARKTLKADAITTHIPVVALTAHAMSDQQEQAFQVGFDGYITKPINTRTFLEVVRAFLKETSPIDL